MGRWVMETGGGEKRQSPQGVPNGRLDSQTVNGKRMFERYVGRDGNER